MKRTIIRITVYALLVFLPVFFFISCQDKRTTSDGHGKIKVVTTLFPLYDFAKNIGEDKAIVSLLLPPGVEAHAFEPGPSDISRIQNADIFIFTGPSMEPWVARLLQGIDTKKVAVIDTSVGINLSNGRHDDDVDHSQEQKHLHEHKSHTLDPHVWLDFSNAIKIVNTITEGFINRDSRNRDKYRNNAEAYKKELEELDKKYRDTLFACKSRVIIHAGHFAFGYLAKKYDLKYVSAYKGFMPNSEPTPKRIVEVIKTLKKYGLKTIYYEELIDPKVADTISRETGCNLLMLHGAHNISKEDMDRGVAFIPLMEKNLEHLRIGMQCP